MGDSVSVDPAVLREAAGRLDTLYDTAGTSLRDTDRAIADSHDGWREDAATAFGRFTGYLDNRRTTLQRQLAELSEALKTTAATLQTQDQSRAANTTQLQSSLDL
ncbi:WXG100 family type VII secretion target [Nocardia tenerifensis]|uniref:WXG100 family type VII secretion target n=1 Tax=Nocardia tenerifensis TaxID=228006 RepID=A0A318JSX1_9NOCA|nr:WXG100 family type VII secretion target [Nocardia tenerifensis]PXX53397.1 WXG100 family type VII secretion target [Nocardia tenerifensis]